MDAITRKGRGRKAKPLADAQDSGEAANSIADDTGNGQVGESGLGAQAGNDPACASISWDAMIGHIEAMFGFQNITKVWHPDAAGESIPMPNGVNIAVFVGDTAYQLSSGQITRI